MIRTVWAQVPGPGSLLETRSRNQGGSRHMDTACSSSSTQAPHLSAQWSSQCFPAARKQEIIKTTEQLIEAVNNGDFEAYA